MQNDFLPQWKNVGRAFSKQSIHFDEADISNPVLQNWRNRVYNHVDLFIKPNSKILELNAGTGIDAMHFSSQGHRVHATDLSRGMIDQMQKKISTLSLEGKITVQQVSFDQLNLVEGKFDYVFSNFGGLNCIDDLRKVTTHLPHLINSGGMVTWVIMPRVAPWEWLWLFKGRFSAAFRRFNKHGVTAHLEGEYFQTYYHSLREIIRSFDNSFKLVKAEALGVASPPPSALNFFKDANGVSRFLTQVDFGIRNLFPFNRWGDHVIVTFQKL